MASNRHTLRPTAIMVAVGLILTAAWSQSEIEEGKPFTDRVPESEYDFEMIPIPEGTIEFEDPDNPGQKKAVEVGPLWVLKTEVPWEMFDPWVDLEERAFMLDLPMDPDGISGPTPPYTPPDQGWGHEGYPALTLSSKSAQDFCRWLSRERKKKYRLATEAEWNYILRAGEPSADAILNDLDNQAWHSGNAEEKGHPVGTKEPNAWGVHDLLGNVSEWCVGPDGTFVLCGGNYQMAPEAFKKAEERIPATKENLNKWLEQDPQIPKSVWWLAGPTFHGFRIVCEGPLAEDEIKAWIEIER